MRSCAALALAISIRECSCATSQPADGPRRISRRLSGVTDRSLRLGGTSAAALLTDACTPTNLLVAWTLSQDLFNPEYYMGAYRNGTTAQEPSPAWHSLALMEGPVAGIMPTVADEAEHHIWERRPFVAVPVPGEGVWAALQDAGAAQAALCAQQTQAGGAAAAAGSAKRGRDDGGDDTVASMEEVDDIEVQPDAAEAAKRSRDAATAVFYKYRVAGAGASGSATPVSISGRAGGSAAAGVGATTLSRVIIKAYGGENELRLNEVVEVVGVLVRTPEVQAVAAAAAAEDAFVAGEDAVHNPPHSRVPRLHAVVMHRVGDGTAGIAAACPAAAEVNAAAELRLRVAAALTAALGGDTAATEFALAALLARVHSRDPTIGHYAVNLDVKGAPAGIPAALRMVAEALVPRVAPVPLTVETLNAAPAVPRKDYAADCMVGGALQLAEGTLLLVDETRLASGKLSAVGVANLEALKAIVEEQALEYDFEYYKMPVGTDVQVLVISDGRSLIPNATVCPVRTQHGGALPEQAAAQAMAVLAAAPGGLDAARSYMAGAVARARSMSIGEAAAARIEADFVTARQEQPKLSMETMHGWLSAAKLLAASHGEVQLSVERWAAFRALDHTRAERIRAP